MEKSYSEKYKEKSGNPKSNAFLGSLFSGNQKTNPKDTIAEQRDLESGSPLSEKDPANLSQQANYSQMAEQSIVDDADSEEQMEDGKEKEEPLEVHKDHWKHFYDAVDERDEEFCKALRDEISDLLLIAALLLGVVTSFAVEALDWLRDDPGTTLLQDIVTLLSQTAPNVVEIDPGLGDLKQYELRVNQLWLLSMILSLSAVIFGTLCLQWLSAFRHADDKYKAGPDTLALRQVRFEGIWAWGVPHIPALLIMIVQAALVFFIVGLLYFLWNVNKHAALPVAIVGGISTFAVAWTMFLPVMLSVVCYMRPSLGKTICQCPYKNPWTWLTHRGFTLIAIMFSFVFTLTPSSFHKRASEWRKRAVRLLVDFRWLEYDEMWRQRRDPGAKEGLCSYYLLNGLGTVVDTLGAHQSTGHFVEKCLQDLKFHDSPADIEAINKSFQGLSFTLAERKVLENKITAGSPSQANADSQVHDPVRLRKEFLTTLILEQLVSRSRPLKHSLFRFRVKQYIRFKALVSQSGLAHPIAPKSDRKTDDYIGGLIECPIKHAENAEFLSSAERSYYIKCIEPLIKTDQLNDKDIIGLQLILRVSESQDHRRSSVKQDEPVGELSGGISPPSSPILEITSIPLSTAVAHNPHDADGITHQDGLSRRDTSLNRLRRTREKLDRWYPSLNASSHQHEDVYRSPSFVIARSPKIRK